MESQLEHIILHGCFEMPVLLVSCGIYIRRLNCQDGYVWEFKRFTTTIPLIR